MKSSFSSNNFTESNKMRFFAALFSILVSVYVIATFAFPYISPDSGFYLKIAHDLSTGTGFYKDLNVAYTPLGMYFYAALFKLIPQPAFWIINSFVLYFYVLNNALLFSIFRMLKIDKMLSMVLVASHFLSYYILQGTHILLEQFVLTFHFTTLLFLLKWNNKRQLIYLLLGGASCFLAFFTKQYGLFILPGIGWFLLSRNDSKRTAVRNILVFGLGFLFPLALVFSEFVFIQKIPVEIFTKKLLGIEVLNGSEVITGADYKFSRFIEKFLNFFIQAPFVVLIFVFAFNKKLKFINKTSVFLALLCLGGCTQLLFASYSHYYQLILPYCLILVGYLIAIQEEKAWIKLRKTFQVLAIVGFASGLFFLQNDFRILIQKNAEQTENREILNRILPPHSKVYLEGILPPYYYVCMFDTPEPHLLGYRFPEEMTLERISKSLPVESYILLHPTNGSNQNFQNGFKFVRRIKLHRNKECLLLKKTQPKIND